MKKIYRIQLNSEIIAIRKENDDIYLLYNISENIAILTSCKIVLILLDYIEGCNITKYEGFDVFKDTMNKLNCNLSFEI